MTSAMFIFLLRLTARLVRSITSHWPSPPPELLTLRRTVQRSGAFVLVAEN
jgi:hypothetical protein